jgi:Holliday junction resolvase RusA-like endonuclease
VGKHGAYTPLRTRAYEDKVRMFAHIACRKPLEGPVSVRLEICGKGRGDIDNQAKAYAMNHIVYDDDRQVIKLSIERFFEGEPKAEVLVRGA